MCQAQHFCEKRKVSSSLTPFHLFVCFSCITIVITSLYLTLQLSQDVTVTIAKRRNFSSKMGSYVMQTFPIVWNIYTKTSRGSTLSRPLSEGYGYKQWMVKHSNIFFPHRTTVGNNSAENTKIASKEFMTENFPTIAKIIRPATNPTEHNNVRKRN